MTSRPISFIARFGARFGALVAAPTHDASAQFGGQFRGLFGGGPKVETIEIAALAKMLGEQREPKAKAKTSSVEVPTTTKGVHTDSDRYRIPAKYEQVTR